MGSSSATPLGTLRAVTRHLWPEHPPHPGPALPSPVPPLAPAPPASPSAAPLGPPRAPPAPWEAPGARRLAACQPSVQSRSPKWSSKAAFHQFRLSKGLFWRQSEPHVTMFLLKEGPEPAKRVAGRPKRPQSALSHSGTGRERWKKGQTRVEIFLPRPKPAYVHVRIAQNRCFGA